MVKKGINLIKKGGGEWGLKRTVKTLNLVGFFALVVYFLLLAGGFFYGMRLEATEKEVVARQREMEQKIKSFSQTEVLQQDVKLRLGALVKIFPQQIDFKEILDFIQKVLPAGVQPESVAVNEGGSVVLGVRAGDSLAALDLEDSVYSQEGKGSLKGAKLTTISRDEEGGYRIGLDLKLNF